MEQFAEPWWYVFFIALGICALMWRRMSSEMHAALFASLGTLACMVAVFFSAATKAPTYLVPLYPFAILVIALASAPLFNSRLRMWTGATATALVLWGGVLAVYNAYHYNPYFSIVTVMAQEEHVVGDMLSRMPLSSGYYVYGVPNLGSIKYYSQHLDAYALVPGTMLPPGSYVLLDTPSLHNFSAAFQAMRTRTAFSGTYVTLLQVQ
jgi:hypothetical protein